MATTLATGKQATAIRQRMQEIRTELPYDVDAARQRVKQLSDWKYHMARHPIPILAASVVAGFLIVPRKRSPPKVELHRESTATPPAPAKRGLLGGIAGAAGTMLLRHATSMAANRITSRYGGHRK